MNSIDIDRWGIVQSIEMNLSTNRRDVDDRITNERVGRTIEARFKALTYTHAVLSGHPFLIQTKSFHFSQEIYAWHKYRRQNTGEYECFVMYWP
jgi:hypothetical protein